jgi:hypothetical protein
MVLARGMGLSQIDMLRKGDLTPSRDHSLSQQRATTTPPKNLDQSAWLQLRSVRRVNYIHSLSL